MKTNAPDRERRAARPEHIARCLLALGLFVAAGNVWASCVSEPSGAGALVQYTNGFVVRFPRDIEMGIPFRTLLVRSDNVPTRWFNCTFDAGYVVFQGATGALVGDVYRTSIQGLGIRMTKVVTNQENRLPWSAFVSETRFGLGGTVDVYKFEFIRTGEIDPNGAISGDLMTIDVPGHGYRAGILRLSSPITIDASVPSCHVTTPLVELDIGPVDGRMLKANGSSPPSPVQNIVLQWRDGQPGKSVAVSMVMTDASDGSNPTNRLSARSADGDPIPGLGIQLLRQNGTPIAFGPDSDVDDAPGQWPVGSTPNNPAYQIPIRARYVYSGTADIPGGTAGAAATFTMNYR